MKSFSKYRIMKLLQVSLAIYIVIMTLGSPGGLRDPETGLIVDQASEERTDQGLILINGDLRPIVCDTPFQLVCLGITRISVFFMYPGKFNVHSTPPSVEKNLELITQPAALAIVLVFLTKFRATTSFF
jgi:hypothetical protein